MKNPIDRALEIMGGSHLDDFRKNTEFNICICDNSSGRNAILEFYDSQKVVKIYFAHQNRDELRFGTVLSISLDKMREMFFGYDHGMDYDWIICDENNIINCFFDFWEGFCVIFYNKKLTKIEYDKINQYHDFGVNWIKQEVNYNNENFGFFNLLSIIN